MKTFEYKGYDATGRSRRGLIEALDIKQAREKLTADGILPEQVAPAGAVASRWGLRAGRSFPLETRAVFYHELVTLLRAGLPLVPALEVLIQLPEMGRRRSMLAGVRDRIREGASLAKALAAASAQVGPYEQAVIAAGERAAALDSVLERLALFLEGQGRLRERIVTALIYPAIIFVVAVGMAVGLLGFAVPRIGNMLMEQTHVALPLLTRMMLGLGRALAVYGLPVLAVILGAAFVAWRSVRRDPERALVLSSRLFSLPVLGRAYHLLANLRFTRTLALLLQGGIPLVDSLQLAGEATGSAWIGRLVTRETDAVRHGASLAEALRRIPPFAASLAGWVQVGEASGMLGRLLESAADRFQQQWDRYLARLLAILEPALILLIGGFVLLVALSILLPIISLNQTIR